MTPFLDVAELGLRANQGESESLGFANRENTVILDKSADPRKLSSISLGLHG